MDLHTVGEDRVVGKVEGRLEGKAAGTVAGMAADILVDTVDGKEVDMAVGSRLDGTGIGMVKGKVERRMAEQEEDKAGDNDQVVRLVFDAVLKDQAFLL